MLSYLRVENFAVVEKVELHFAGHLNVLTGETGAGKSILIDAINLLLNKKVPPNLTREGEKKLVVEAMFTHGDDEVVFRREITNGRSLCYLDGSMVPFAKLQEEAQDFLNIYGQHEQTFLLNASNHRVYLDVFAHSHGLLKELEKCYDDMKKLTAELKGLQDKGQKAHEKLDFIDFQVNEIESLKMERGEDIEIEQQVKILSSAEDILSRSELVIRDLHEDDASAYNKIAENLPHLHFLKDIYPELASQVEEIEKFYELLPEITSSISALVGQIDYNEDELDNLENRLMKLNRLKQKYKMDLDGLLDKLEELRAERHELSNMNFSIKDKQAEIDKKMAEYRRLNTDLRANRKEKAQKLCSTMEKELSKLEMKRARFLVDFDEKEPDVTSISPRGTDKVEFYFSSNPGQTPGPVKDVASGGELSRLMLVLKSLIEEDNQATYIFDEIDSGIGGKTAEFVGEKLQRIADSNQVICISHLPQIASFAGRHFLVEKEFKEDKTFSYVKQLSNPERVREIGRLMVGSNVNDEVLKAAESLLNKNCGDKDASGDN